MWKFPVEGGNLPWNAGISHGMREISKGIRQIAEGKQEITEGIWEIPNEVWEKLCKEYLLNYKEIHDRAWKISNSNWEISKGTKKSPNIRCNIIYSPEIWEMWENP